MRRVTVSGIAASVLLSVCGFTTSSTAGTVIVDNIGSINESSISLPSTKMPAAGDSFTYYFEFTLPKAEYVSASMSISGPVPDQIPAGDGSFILSTSNGASPPSGTVLEQTLISNPDKGGQGAFLGTMTSMGDFEQAGSYFIEIAGVSPSTGATLQLAVDGNVTAAAPELSTWALLLLGFGGLGFARYGKRRTGRLSDSIA